MNWRYNAKKLVYLISGALFRNRRLRGYIFNQCSRALIGQRELDKKMIDHTAGELKVVHIETRTKCNGRCEFCPAAVQYKTRSDSLMPDDLFRKIIYDLRNMDYSYRISLYCNNEPLLDKRIFDFVAFAKSKCNKALIELKTNGILLNITHIESLIEAGLDSLYVNDYHTNPGVSDRLEKLCRSFQGKSGNTSIVYSNRMFNEISGKNNRGGSNPSMDSLKKSMDAFCYRPFEMLTITTDGRVSVCSNDVFFRNAIGCVNEHTSLADLWQGEKINQLRKSLLEHRRDAAPCCNDCDYPGLDIGHQYSSIYRYILPFMTDYRL